MRTPALVAVLLVACAHSVPKVEPQSSLPADDEIMAPPSAPSIVVAPKKGRTYANIRMFADSKSAVIAKVPVGTVLRTFGSDGQWHQVQVPATGALGWIHTIYLE